MYTPHPDEVRNNKLCIPEKLKRFEVGNSNLHWDDYNAYAEKQGGRLPTIQEFRDEARLRVAWNSNDWGLNNLWVPMYGWGKDKAWYNLRWAHPEHGGASRTEPDFERNSERFDTAHVHFQEKAPFFYVSTNKEVVTWRQ